MTLPPIEATPVTEIEVNNLLHRMNLDRNDIKDLPEGHTIAVNITTHRQAADIIKRLWQAAYNRPKAEVDEAKLYDAINKVPHTRRVEIPCSACGGEPDIAMGGCAKCWTSGTQSVDRDIPYMERKAMTMEILRPYLTPCADVAGLVERALEEAARIVLNLKPEMHRDKVSEWEACYAALFRQLNEVVQSHTAAQNEKLREVQIGRFTLRDHKLKVGCVTIIYESGEGGTFSEEELEKVIEGFYAKNF